ncbi:hypothetical protein [Companilactobacillus sp. HBUAS59699]|uniref:hypothetical protein n=1 Tax=Companilactobacillus sp. HBUAS59699 TaxID=3109358 RepID=UPI002FF2ACC2
MMIFDKKMDKLFNLMSDAINSGENGEILTFFENNNSELKAEFPDTINFIESHKLIDNLSSSSTDRGEVLNNYFEAKNIYDLECFNGAEKKKSSQSKIVKLEIAHHDSFEPLSIFRNISDNYVPSDIIEKLIIDGKNNSIEYHLDSSKQSQVHKYNNKTSLDDLLYELNDQISKFDDRSKVLPDAFLQLKVIYANDKKQFFFYKNNDQLPKNWKEFVEPIKKQFNVGRLNQDIFQLEPPEEEYFICKVKFSDYSNAYSYLAPDENLKKGDRVLVPVGNNNERKEVTVDSVGKYTNSTSSYPISKMKHVIAKVYKSYDYYDDDEVEYNQPSTDYASSISISSIKLQQFGGNVIVDDDNAEDLVLLKQSDCSYKYILRYPKNGTDTVPYYRILNFAKEKNIHSLAIPDRFSEQMDDNLDDIATYALQTIGDWLESNDQYDIDITIACSDDSSYDAYSEFVDMYEGDNVYLIDADY